MVSKRPAPGDIVMYRDPRSSTSGATRVGRVKKRQGDVLSVRPPTWKSNQRVPLANVYGWWPKGAKNRSTSAMREVGT